MANINCATLLEDIKMLLPSGNLLTDDQMLIVIKRVMAQVGSDEEYYGQVACKSLRAIATVNASKADVEVGKLKREKVGEHEEEYFASGSGGDAWKDFIDSLTEVCPIMFGYSLPSGAGMFINTTPLPKPLCPTSYATNCNNLYE